VFVVFYEALYKGGEIQLSEEHESFEWVPIATWNPADVQFQKEEGEAIQTFLKMKRTGFKNKTKLKRSIVGK
jgi:hypothetical protein